MKYKKGLVFICLIICLFTIATVCAGEVNDTVAVGDGQNNDLMNMENQNVEEPDVSCENEHTQPVEKISNSDREKLGVLFIGKNCTVLINEQVDYTAYCLHILTENEAEGNLSIFVDNALKWTKHITINDYDQGYNKMLFFANYLGLASQNKYLISVTFNDNTFSSYSYISAADNLSHVNRLSAYEINEGDSVVLYNYREYYLDTPMNVYIDNKLYKSFTSKSYEIEEVIHGLKSGNHEIIVSYDNENIFYRETYHVHVKATASNQMITPSNLIKITLKTVKVKKSAKKLVLQATLKQDNKALNGKKITFKFNGKTYKSKTNKKGIAKVTIKKAILKKLKVGKKVKYQASYGKIIAKKTAKVKK